jgi:hypothetical protein
VADRAEPGRIWPVAGDERGLAAFDLIIYFRSKLAKGMDADERHALERRVASYSNSLVKRK